ncbi:hypothetical protein [Nocardioides sp. LML1-1-1.1]|uniref:hypothetical protein n=1 Tax=Nocardioides sp. LML1-1-1.1 TaxID=3135248 RepID=UPI003421AC7B
MVDEAEENEGQLSEVASRKAAGEVTPGDAVAGHPSDREVQEGSTGPNARTGEDHHPADVDHEAVVDEEHDVDPEIAEEADQDQYPRVQDVEEDRA